MQKQMENMQKQMAQAAQEAQERLKKEAQEARERLKKFVQEAEEREKKFVQRERELEQKLRDATFQSGQCWFGLGTCVHCLLFLIQCAFCRRVENRFNAIRRHLSRGRGGRRARG